MHVTEKRDPAIDLSFTNTLFKFNHIFKLTTVTVDSLANISFIMIIYRLKVTKSIWRKLTDDKNRASTCSAHLNHFEVVFVN